MSLRKNYQMDETRQEKGALVVLPANADGSVPRIWVRRITSSEGAYQNAMERIMAPHRREHELGVLPATKFNELLLQVFAEGAIASWENVLLADVTNDDNATGFAEATDSNKYKLLALLPELYQDLRVGAVQRANYLKAAADTDAKN